LAVGLFNRGEGLKTVSVKWETLGLRGQQLVRDLWRQTDVGTFATDFEAFVGRHGVVLIRIRAAVAGIVS
jgi:alpha-galactosidase